MTFRDPVHGPGVSFLSVYTSTLINSAFYHRQRSLHAEQCSSAKMNSQLGLRATYSPSLRDRSIWKVIEPVLTASSEGVEGQLRCLWLTLICSFVVTTSPEARSRQISDFNFQQINSAQPLQVLLLTPSSLEDNEKQNTSLRLRHFAAPDTLPYPKKAVALMLSQEAFTTASGKYSLDGLLALQVLYGPYVSIIIGLTY